jgi:hypothetical protein
MKTGIIQLYDSEGQEAGLYMYDMDKIEPSHAINKVEIAFESCKEADHVQDAADEVLRMHGIIRVFADEANTDII